MRNDVYFHIWYVIKINSGAPHNIKFFKKLNSFERFTERARTIQDCYVTYEGRQNFVKVNIIALQKIYVDHESETITWILLTWLSRYRDNITISIMLLSSLNIDSSAKTIEIYKYIMHNISLKIAKYLWGCIKAISQ